MTTASAATAVTTIRMSTGDLLCDIETHRDTSRHIESAHCVAWAHRIG